MTSPADTDLFIAKKTAQWERIAGTQPGLQLVQSGKTQAFTLIKSVDEFYEGVLIGQIASVKRVAEKVGKRTHYRVLREDEKAVDKRGVDLSDEQIDQVLQRWALGQSALSLRFIDCVFTLSGDMVTKS